jgi:hypothetical protein
MKLLTIILLLPAFCVAQQSDTLQMKLYYPDRGPKYDTVKCYVVTAEWNKDSTAHLIINKAWMVRRYELQGHEVNLSKNTLSPYFSLTPRPLKFLHANKRDSITVIKDFLPIIQDWK